LSSEFLVPFQYSNDSLIDCPAFREKGIDGFFNRLMGKEADDQVVPDSVSQPEEKPEEKQRSRVGRFFDRIFKGKKK
jgi:hypothetical protein